MKVYFPIHFDGGNRGCEGIAKGTAKILGLAKEKLIGLCSNVQLDTELGVGQYVTLVEKKKMSFACLLIGAMVSKISVVLAKRYFNSVIYKFFVDKIGHDDIMLLTGGDMMCYDDNEVNYINNFTNKKGVRSVLWGCSIDENNLTPAKKETLRKFSCIYARESLSYELLMSLNLKNVLLFPDPAFVLSPEECSLPILFKNGNVVGINLSNYVVGGDNLNTEFGLEMCELIDYIISNTDLNILLIPHVLWKGQDDRLISQEIIKMYNNDRIAMLESEKYNYEQIRYVISKCILFIGARTHAIISAYATCTPAIALGYSVKSRGIAKDLQLDENLIIDSKNFRKNQLLESFIYTLAHLGDIKSHLELTIPLYVKRMESLKKEVFEILKT